MDIITPALRVEWRNAAHTWDAIPGAELLTPLSLRTALTGNADNPVVFGDSSENTMSFVVGPASSYLAQGWKWRKVRAFLGTYDVPAQVFEGVIMRRSRAKSSLSMTYEARGYCELIKRSKPLSPLYYRRYGATRTDASSIEDPSDSAYRAGIINYALWKAGGRPYAQKLRYPNARFYYHCDQAVLAPEWAWLHGEDAWAECARVARSCGGMMFQDNLGIVRFVSPFAPTDGVATFTFSPGIYQDLTEDTDIAGLADRVRVPWVFRALQGTQLLYTLPAPLRLPPAGTTSFPGYASVDIQFDTDHPVYSWQHFAKVGDTVWLKTIGKAANVSDYSQVPITPDRNTRENRGVGYIVMELSAQHVRLRLQHNYPEPIRWNALEISGAPVVPVSAGSSVAGQEGDEAAELGFEDSPFVSNEDHGEQLAEMALAYYHAERPVRKATGCVYRPELVCGTRVYVYDPDFGITTPQLHVIVAVEPDNGILASYDLVPVDDLPQGPNMYVWGRAYSAWTKQAIW